MTDTIETAQETGLPPIDSEDTDTIDEINFESDVKPMPNGLKYSLMILPVALIAGIFFMSGKNDGSETMQIGIDGERLNDSVTTQTLIPVNNTKSSQGEQITQLNDANLKYETGQLRLTSTPIDLLNEKIESLSSQVNDMVSVIDDLEEQGIVVNHLKTQVGAIQEQLKFVPTRKELNDVKSDFARQLEQKADELKSSLTKLYKKARKTISRKPVKPVAMPFRLVSIDQWDGVNYAAIQSTSVGGIENLRQGDTRSGWTVTSINSMQMSVTFQHNKSGKILTKNTI